MQHKYKHLAVSDRTHALARGLSKAWGLTTDEAVLAALLTLDKQKGGDSHRILAERVIQIRAKMATAAGRVGAVRPGDAAPRRRAAHGARGARFDHSVWKWQDFKIGVPVFFKAGLHHGAWDSAMRYRAKNEGWNISRSKVSGGYNFTRIS